MAGNELELAHYGIFGMKWGVRRYQNYDGTLTSAGKKRYGGDDDGDGDSARVVTKGENGGGSVSPDSSQARSVKPVSEMSDDELRAFLNRADMERRYNEIVNPKPQQQPQVQEQKKVDTSRQDSVSSLTDDEIRAFLNRVDLEKKYNQIVNPPPPPKQKSAVVEFLKGIALAAVTDVGTKWAKKALSKAMGLEEDKKKDEKKDDKKDDKKDEKKDEKKDDSLDKRVSELERSFKNMNSGGSSGSDSSSKSEKKEKKKKPEKSDDFDSKKWADDWLSNWNENWEANNSINNWSRSTDNWINDWLAKETAEIWKKT